MKILYYSWSEITLHDTHETFLSLGHTVQLFIHNLPDFFTSELQKELSDELSHTSYDCIFTCNYFSTISEIAEKYQTKYICWIYDSPNFDIYSNTLSHVCNYLFLFDRDMEAVAKKNNAAHAYHLPLAVNPERLRRKLNLNPALGSISPQKYLHDISFVGSLYDQTSYERFAAAADHLRGYLHGIIVSQKQIWGTDIISPSLTPDICNQLESYLPIPLNTNSQNTAKDFYAATIQKQLAHEERCTALNLLSQTHNVSLFSNSNTALCPNAVHFGPVSYLEEMPDVFHYSKINLNITLRSITSGIPLRALDTMGCGGFLLSSYQPELCEYFIPGEDFVYFEDFEDMLRKADYYLEHDDEREAIAYSGYCKTSQNFSYPRQLKKMLECIVD